MKIIGISGFENSIPFKKAQWPGLEEREYRISQGHDSAAVLVRDGEIVCGVAEERLKRKKHTGDFPVQAIRWCLDEGGLALEEVDEIAHGFDYAPFRAAYMLDPVSDKLYKEVFSREALLELVEHHLPGFPSSRLVHVNHHMAHAASAYYTSGWDECLVAVIDGMGEAYSISVYHARDGSIDLLHQVPAQDSIGILYSLVTLHLGFDFNADEYKIMGLAPYGNPARFTRFFEEAIHLNGDGSLTIPLLRMNRSRDERENYTASREYLNRHLLPHRHPDGDITDDHRDVAAALQELLDRTMLHICGHFGKQTGQRKLAMAGGVALNCTANGKLLKSGLFDEVYVQPAAGDDGTALGAALYRASVHTKIRNHRMPVPFLGPSYDSSAIMAALKQVDAHVGYEDLGDLGKACHRAAELIGSGKVIAWYRDRMEFGPRALGHRSILADPGDPGMRDRINAMVKMREAFRPFAPAVSLEQVHVWFDVAPNTALPYMIMTVDVREEHRAKLPAITHVNGSARVQTVSASDNADFHSLLKAVGHTTGREMVLNTSFNVKGEAIVNTPREALDTFLKTGIEFLFLGNVVVWKKRP